MPQIKSWPSIEILNVSYMHCRKQVVVVPSPVLSKAHAPTGSGTGSHRGEAARQECRSGKVSQVRFRSFDKLRADHLKYLNARLIHHTPYKSHHAPYSQCATGLQHGSSSRLSEVQKYDRAGANTTSTTFHERSPFGGPTTSSRRNGVRNQ